MKKEIEHLKDKVAAFLQEQPGYDAFRNVNLEAFTDSPESIGVVFGSNIQAGIAGFGENANQAFDDFLLNWKMYEGFEWLKKNN